ncbi:hypothetical protein QBC41DRAFT_379311 [Cercophora samala]|uniref:Hydrophobin n=1 Tax=Cercophora samala TaxID=330535 RepID=A0AA40D9H3_9PEZI|nr:hypothetical protein QBC41DRAFT_379311 [Cercophora samala]
MRMIAPMILIFVPMLIQLAIAGPVERAPIQQKQYRSIGCTNPRAEHPVLEDCHKVINLIGISSPTGLLKLDNGVCITIGVESCAGFICNFLTSPIDVNLPIAAIDMTTHIFDPCVRKSQYGEWAGGYLELGLVPMPGQSVPPGIPGLQPSLSKIEDVKQMFGAAIPAEVDGRISQP